MKWGYNRIYNVNNYTKSNTETIVYRKYVKIVSSELKIIDELTVLNNSKQYNIKDEYWSKKMK